MSIASESENENEYKIVKNLHKYYEALSENDSINSIESKRISMVDDSKLSCSLCSETKKNAQDNFIILSCNHIYHIHCLAQNHFSDKYSCIDENYFDSCKCTSCDKKMQTEEMIFLYSKFHNSTKQRIEYHEKSISNLEEKVRLLRNELRSCYEYKNKLENERDKSKQVIASLMTLM